MMDRHAEWSRCRNDWVMRFLIPFHFIRNDRFVSGGWCWSLAASRKTPTPYKIRQTVIPIRSEESKKGNLSLVIFSGFDIPYNGILKQAFDVSPVERSRRSLDSVSQYCK